MSSLLRIALPIFLLCAAPFADAQTEKRPLRIGVLGSAAHGSPQSASRMLEEELKKSGWVDGKNIQFIWKSSEGEPDRLPELADELVRERVDVIVALVGAHAAAKKTKTIPIVMLGSTFHPVEDGLALSLARPGKNVTGLALGSPRIGNKVFALLKEATPKTSRFAWVWASKLPAPKGVMDLPHGDKEDQADLDALKLTLIPVPFWGISGLPGAFEEAVRQRADAMLFAISPGLNNQEVQARISELAIRHRMPVVHDYLPQYEWGGILAYGNDATIAMKRLPYYVDRILRGANPGDIPIEEPSRYELHVNLKAAKAIGVPIPRSILIQADRVIE